MTEQETFFCGGCGMEYPTDELALQCEDWDEKHPGEPNPELVRNAIVHEEEI